MQTPSIGRIVHFVTKDGTSQAAIIVKVLSPDTVNLQVFRDGQNDHAHDGQDNGLNVYKAGVLQNEDKPNTPNTWHWPPIV